MRESAKASRPADGSERAKVLSIAESYVRETGTLPTGRQVADRHAAEGGNPNTAKTLYSRTIKRQLREILAEPSAPPSAEWLSVGSDGRLPISPAIRAAMRLDASGKVLAQVVDGELRLRSVPVALERVQTLMREFDKGEGSVVDELIRDRRTEAEQE